MSDKSMCLPCGISAVKESTRLIGHTSNGDVFVRKSASDVYWVLFSIDSGMYEASGKFCATYDM